MQLDNSTAFPAEVVRSQTIYRDLLLATVVVKLGFEIDEHGEARPLPQDEQLGIYEADTETPLGWLETDLVPIKRGCDLAMYGNAVSPEAKPVTELEVGVQISSGFERRVRVVGDRAWLPTGVGVRMSDPQWFIETPITWDRAYGGRAVQVQDRTQTLAAPFPANPDGRGHVVHAQLAPGVLLPNVEELDQPIRRWEDQPLPASFLPVPRRSSLRGSRGINIDVEGQRVKFQPEAFCFSHPRMWMPSYPHGERVFVWGMRREGPWRLTLPNVHLSARLELGDSVFTLRLEPDTLLLLPAWNRLIVIARRAVVYQFKPERLRRFVIEAVGGTVEDHADAANLFGLTSIAAQREAGKDGRAQIELLPVELDPNKLPLPFESFVEADPMGDLLDHLPLCPSN
jgi:hypothetical protein